MRLVFLCHLGMWVGGGGGEGARVGDRVACGPGPTRGEQARAHGEHYWGAYECPERTRAPFPRVCLVLQ